MWAKESSVTPARRKDIWERVFRFNDVRAFSMTLCGIEGETLDRTRRVAGDVNLRISSDWDWTVILP